MKKLLVGVITALCCFAAAMSAFAGCGQNNDSGADKTAELQTKIEELQTQITELQEENAELKESVKDYNNLVVKIEELQKLIKNHIDEYDSLNYGKQFTIAEAYSLDMITKNDVESVANYYNNDIQYSETLTEKETKAIKEAAAKHLRNSYNTSQAVAEGIIITKFLGNYSGYYAIKFTTKYYTHPAQPLDYWEEICGVQFHITDYDFISIFKINL